MGSPIVSLAFFIISLIWLLKIIVASSSIPKFVLFEIYETVMLLKIKGGW